MLMAEEEAVKENQEGEAVQTPSESKKKKINKLTLDELNKKIKEMEEKKLSHSKYCKHLQERKNELEKPQA